MFYDDFLPIGVRQKKLLIWIRKYYDEYTTYSPSIPGLRARSNNPDEAVEYYFFYAQPFFDDFYSEFTTRQRRRVRLCMEKLQPPPPDTEYHGGKDYGITEEYKRCVLKAIDKKSGLSRKSKRQSQE